jgi:hypothetical protein
MALEKNISQDGSMSFLVFDETEGKSQVVSVPEIAQGGNKELAMYARKGIAQLAGNLIPLSQKMRAFSPHMPLVYHMYPLVLQLLRFSQILFKKY